MNTSDWILSITLCFLLCLCIIGVAEGLVAVGAFFWQTFLTFFYGITPLNG